MTATNSEKIIVWDGRNSIFNVAYNGVGRTILAMLPAAMAFRLLTTPLKDSSVSGALGQWGFGMFCIVLVLLILRHSRWLNVQWQLIATRNGLTYSARRGGLWPHFIATKWLDMMPPKLARFFGGKMSPVWSVSFDEIARVESGQTVEWETSRNYPALLSTSIKPIPDTEYQVFIFCDDGRRLIVHTANAAREECGRWAIAIRSYVEAQRSAAAPSASSSDPSSSAPRADGFDL